MHKLRVKSLKSQITWNQCSYDWRTSRWSECSAKCGGGTMVRSVRCVNVSGGKMDNVDDRYCSEEKPTNVTNCAQLRCPDWNYGAWGEVKL